MTIFLVIVILVLLIIVHELGHFFVAKTFRVKVEEFGIGYPPRAFTLGKFGGTEYTINWIPFGGFVRLFGDEAGTQRRRGGFVDANRGVQAAILLAGVAMNVVAAWFLFTVAFHMGVPRVVETLVPGQNAKLLVANVVPGSPADAAGIKPGDEIKDMTEASGKTPSALSPSAVVDFVKERAGKPINLTYVHEGISHETTVTPANAVIPHAAGQPALGIQLALVANQALPWSSAAAAAIFETRDAFVLVAGDLWGLLSGALRGSFDISEVVGPVGIVSYVGQASQNGWGTVLFLAGIISVNLAIINLIPIPALDGGRIAILLFEVGMRRSASHLALQMFNALGIGLIVLLMIVVTYQDIGRLLV
ncbi:MAG: M50 family metallopeptidase [Patescibacteria group bacterium]